MLFCAAAAFFSLLLVSPFSMILCVNAFRLFVGQCTIPLFTADVHSRSTSDRRDPPPLDREDIDFHTREIVIKCKMIFVRSSRMDGRHEELR